MGMKGVDVEEAQGRGVVANGVEMGGRMDMDLSWLGWAAATIAAKEEGGVGMGLSSYIWSSLSGPC